MKKNHYAQLGALALAVTLVGCAAGKNGTAPLAAVDRGLSNVESAAQSGREILNAGTAATSDPAGAATIGLVDILEHRLGVSKQQAMGGAGAIFQLAQGKMTPDAFSAMARSVPGMDQMLGAAPPMSNLSSGLSSLMGDSNNTLGSVAALAASFQQLDLSPDMVGRFIPVVTNYVQQASGQVIAEMLQSALTAR
ncbi:MAG: DUF2780 domain-containing protein [Nitrosomonas sp.]|nr:MAG: DUF2780 domain-containing protein [Nitrosomonas sp.]